MSVILAPLASTPYRADREGRAGPFAKFKLPLQPNYFLPDGTTLTFGQGTIPQTVEPFMSGLAKADTYQKDCCSCMRG